MEPGLIERKTSGNKIGRIHIADNRFDHYIVKTLANQQQENQLVLMR